MTPQIAGKASDAIAMDVIGPTANVAEDLVASTWAEADIVMAIVWRDFARLEKKLDKATRARSDHRVRALVADAALEALALRQALSHAARIRGMHLSGDEGAIVSFDPRVHEAENDLLRRGDNVRIVRAGVARGVGKSLSVLARALVKRTRGAP